MSLGCKLESSIEQIFDRRHDKFYVVYDKLVHICNAQLEDIAQLGLDTDVQQTIAKFYVNLVTYSQKSWFDNSISVHELKHAYQKASCCHSNSQCQFFGEKNLLKNALRNT